MKLFFSLFVSILLVSFLDAGNAWAKFSITTKKDSNQRQENPVIPGDFADPSVIRVGDTYYATGTSSEWAPHFPLYQSTDLIHWKSMGYVFPQTPSWASASFWAPELYYRKGTYYVYYVARKKSDGISCIGVATSRNPAQGFTDRGIILEYGKEAIDAFIIEDKGQQYITWKAYGLDQRPIEILGSKLSDDGLKLEGEPFTLLRDDQKEGLEGQCLVKRNQYYYLFYSPGNCCGRGCNYKVEVARSASIQGPYTRFEGNPLLAETDEWKCTGHGTLVTSREGKDYYLYHAYSKADDVYTGRQGMLGEVIWDSATGWPQVKPLGEKAKAIANFKDDFSGTSLSGQWQWDFRHAEPEVQLSKGQLSLAGKNLQTNLAGTAMTIRPLKGDYEISTEVMNQNASLKSLVLYGDAAQAVGVGVKDRTVEVWEVKKDKRSVLRQEKLVSNEPVELKMTVKKGAELRFYWRQKSKTWKELPIQDSPYNGEFLPPWDRSPRPGVLQQGAITAPALFNFFDLHYQ
ncbi:glycoside hydrolase family 43 protein [Siphonobacter sp. SORGH_AS_0500]|uniref:glycoside hydrolase family 43 protein n=1 Tax=Siphonobacter sp. SORGH_AS_0500 TaxID=1864824 RepID=UPI0028584C9D|nr:glycoside hydrolase family 43 protein [Siphonobacter sp. SORGH_AS_0500]MDR6197222.1 beta-xylosidase [Siphonobacter sp. SORGH_AS_0500]